MKLPVPISELIIELVIEGLLLYAVYIFWRRYRRNANPILLVLTATFVLLFVAHTIFSLIMEDVMGYKFSDPFDPYHLYFLVTLVLLIYLAHKAQWRVKLSKRLLKEEDEDEEKAC